MVRKNSIHFVILFVCALATAALAQVSGQERLIGNWELQERRDLGTGSTYSFRSNGALVITSGVMLDFDARADGDELLATVAAQRGGTEPVRVRAAGDTLTYMQSGQPQNWARLGKAAAGQPAFAGVWAVDQSVPPRSKKKKDDEMAQLLRENMRLTITPAATAGPSTVWKVRMRCPISNDGGSYTVQGSKLIMQYSGKVWVAAFRIDGNTLYLTRQGENAESIFERAE